MHQFVLNHILMTTKVSEARVVPKHALLHHAPMRWPGWWLRRREAFPAREVWQRVCAGLPALAHLDAGVQRRLVQVARRFLQAKAVTGAGGQEITDEVRSVIGAQAALLILNLDLGYYDTFHEIIVYPDTFLVEHEETDETGVVHRYRRPLSGEAWTQGPVILSWADARPDVPRAPGQNVVIHEFAHKLDMADGAANGRPPLHRGVDPEAWSREFTAAWNRLQHEWNQEEWGWLDLYALDSPAEFFSVASEYFFQSPDVLRERLPGVYVQLRDFYRQDPAAGTTL